MKKSFLLLLIAVLLGTLSFFGARAWVTSRKHGHDGGGHHAVASEWPELQWLRGELRLTDEQFQKVEALHQRYMPTCEAMCASIAASRAKLERLAAESRQVTPELTAAFQERADLDGVCRKAMLSHFYETAACMNDNQAARYLETVLPHALGTAADKHRD